MSYPCAHNPHYASGVRAVRGTDGGGETGAATYFLESGNYALRSAMAWATARRWAGPAARLSAFTVQMMCVVHLVNQHLFEVRMVRTWVFFFFFLFG